MVFYIDFACEAGEQPLLTKLEMIRLTKYAWKEGWPKSTLDKFVESSKKVVKDEIMGFQLLANWNRWRITQDKIFYFIDLNAMM